MLWVLIIEWLGLRKCPRYVIGTDHRMARIKKMSKVTEVPIKVWARIQKIVQGT